MDWRTWAYQKLIGDAAFTALVPAASVYGAGSLTQTPEKKPFVVLRFGPAIAAPVPDTHYTELQVWAHDRPGDYLRIQEILAQAKTTLVGQIVSIGAIACRWQGDSNDLADDGLGTITRNSSFRLVGND